VFIILQNPNYWLLRASSILIIKLIARRGAIVLSNTVPLVFLAHAARQGRVEELWPVN
jgi:hypothetical protein